jgi:hypothetical protein
MIPILRTLLCSAILSLLPACGGPDTANLLAEKRAIEQELMQLELIANQMRAQMSQAEWQSFFGGFAAGFGIVGGDGQVALNGAGAVADAVGSYDAANLNLQQVQNRYNQLAQRWREIQSILQ